MTIEWKHLHFIGSVNPYLYSDNARGDLSNHPKLSQGFEIVLGKPPADAERYKDLNERVEYFKELFESMSEDTQEHFEPYVITGLIYAENFNMKMVKRKLTKAITNMDVNNSEHVILMTAAKKLFE